MTKTGKIILGLSIGIVLIGGGVATYFLLKPKENDKKTGRDGLNYIFKDGKWVKDDGVPNSSGGTSGGTSGGGNSGGTGGGTSGGRKSCYKPDIEKLQIELNKLGAGLIVDGCIGTNTNAAIINYKVTTKNGKYIIPQTTPTPSPTPTQNEYLYLGATVKAKDVNTALIKYYDWASGFMDKGSKKFEKGEKIGKIFKMTQYFVYVEVPNKPNFYYAILPSKVSVI
jgi:hypothetical protein